MKYIHRVHKHYQITKQDPETLKNVYYGMYRNLEEAKMVRDKLIEYNWDKTDYNINMSDIIRASIIYFLTDLNIYTSSDKDALLLIKAHTSLYNEHMYNELDDLPFK